MDKLFTYACSMCEMATEDSTISFENFYELHNFLSLIGYVVTITPDFYNYKYTRETAEEFVEYIKKCLVELYNLRYR